MRQPPDKQLILDSLAAIARGAGRPPSRSEFASLSGISEHSVSQFFPTWNAALRAAGLSPYTLNLRLEDRELLEDWGHAVRRNCAIPARRAYHHLGKFDYRTFERRFGPWSQLPEVFRNFARGKPEWADVLALMPAPAPKPSHRGTGIPASASFAVQQEPPSAQQSSLTFSLFLVVHPLLRAICTPRASPGQRGRPATRGLCVIARCSRAMKSLRKFWRLVG